jgi:hydroxyacyl-ACP dehydratase HTD2-like protein with hotdog domain
MLLETALFHHPGAKLKTFEYRALNPLVVNQPITIHGAWEKASDSSAKKALLVWAVAEGDVVGMSGRITL